MPRKVKKDKLWPRRNLDRFGVCPECHKAGQHKAGLRADGLRRDLFGDLAADCIWMVCEEHRLKWFVSGSYPPLGTIEQRKANTKLLKAYRTVDPSWTGGQSHGAIPVRTRRRRTGLIVFAPPSPSYVPATVQFR